MLHNNVSRYKNRTNKSVLYNKTDYELIKEFSITGLGISSGYSYGSTETEGIIITPNITVESGNPKIVYFDYSRTINENNEKSLISLRDFFSIRGPVNFITGHVFSVDKASYNYSDYNLGGTYAFQNFINDVVISTSTSSSITAGYYDQTRFDYIPRITKVSNIQLKQFSPNTFIITNNLPNGGNSFVGNGVENNSILDLGQTKFIVNSIEIKSNKEYVIISNLNKLENDDVTAMPILNLTTQNIIGLYKQR